MAKNNQLKLLANLAKQRLVNRDYGKEEKPNPFISKNASAYFIENAKALKKLTAKIEYVSISLDEDQNFINKVISLLNNEILINPLGELTDNIYFETLSEREKQLYMLSLSERYNKIKEKYDATSA